MKIKFTFSLLIAFNYLYAQPYKDYLGAGHSVGITVKSSSQISGSEAVNTLNGSGLDAAYFDATRFLNQATLGADSASIQKLLQMGKEKWVEDQFAKKASYTLPLMNDFWKTIFAERRRLGQPEDDIFGPYSVHFNYAWWHTNLTNHLPNQNNDLLRQRVATSLAEILVVSARSDLGDWGDGLSSYYDILLKHAFGNYKDLLKDVSLSLPMGYYLSHLNNPKTNEAEKIRPDENYAREIMQLFTIGLFMLNDDGTEIKDKDGKPIPTYDNNDIKEMAKIFTGLYGSQIMPCPKDCPTWWPKTPEFGRDIYFLVKTGALIMSNADHEPGPKIMPDKKTKIEIPNNGMAEIDAAIDFLFNHKNTPAFISYRLIQRLTTSNPSKAYVQRVANAFKNNGQGVRGDMKAVIRAILLDKENLEQNHTNVNAGMLLNPTLRYTQFCRALKLDSDMNRYWNNGINFGNEVGHATLRAPTVFNFYAPDYTPTGAIKEAKLVAPEFKIHNTSTSINYLNWVGTWSSPWENKDGESGYVMWSWEEFDGMPIDSAVHLDTKKFEVIAHNNELLIHELNKALGRGQLSDATLNNLRYIGTTVDKNTSPNDTWWWPLWRRHKVRIMLYFLMISPDYVIQK
jgi:uncharacterized protein (DUF1800 family)